MTPTPTTQLETIRRDLSPGNERRTRERSRFRLRSALSSTLLFVGAGVAVACASPTDEKIGSASQAATAPSLGTTKSFAVLAGSTVTNIGSTVVSGDLGVSPGLAITGFPPGLVQGGVTHAGDAAALQAQSDATTAYDALAGQACGQTLTGQDLGGMTLTPGTYCFSSSAQLTGTLTLDAQGNPDAVFVFQIGSTLTTASQASVRVINGGTACNVFWQVGSSATLGTTTTFAGTIIALTSITLNTNVSISGRAVARNAAVTMDTGSVSLANCQPSVLDGGVGDVATALDSSAPGDAANAIDTATPVDATTPGDAAAPVSDAAFPMDVGASCGDGNVCAEGSCVDGVCCTP